MKLINFLSYPMMAVVMLSCAPPAKSDGGLDISSKTKVGQIEVGSPYVGIEIHNSFPMLNRISFYYPVANSIDISDDYWRRESSRVMSMGLKVGDSPKFILTDEAYSVTQSPYHVEFNKKQNSTSIKIKYEFSQNRPAFFNSIKITNHSDETKQYELYTRYEAALRTSHTYNLRDKVDSSADGGGSILKINSESSDTGFSQLFFANAEEKPRYYTTNAYAGQYESLNEYWLNSDEQFKNTEITNSEPGKPEVAFVYKKTLAPDESMEVVQIIGSVKQEESGATIDYLVKNYSQEIAAYKDHIEEHSIRNKVITTNIPELDFTSDWARAIMATNAHYIDSEIVPMPAQAEYNFYFTHDALLTDLAAVNFDLARVKKDLTFIIQHADANKVIPHAYYWSDTSYKTEYAGTENWNHFWFVMLSARYLRHSADLDFSEKLYPYVKKSLQTALKNKGRDGLMWSFRPDWWDIGNNFGPRAYMTILAIRALNEFSFFAASLNKNEHEIKSFELIADQLHKNLIEKLWNNDIGYLTSIYADGTEDKHIYMGSLLASHFNLLENDKNIRLLNTANQYLLDEKLGIYTLFPMDFHKLKDFMGFDGNEAGAPFHYANGGIWPHGNAWYALALINNGKHDEAYQFIKQIMTIDGVINSPNGQPAMYEYRISDKSNPEIYGKIDKPQFLWAGGWYLYTLYNLFGIKENEWNISFSPYLHPEMKNARLSLAANGDMLEVDITGHGDTISSISLDEKKVPSAVFPADAKNVKGIHIILGKPDTPYLDSANANVHSPEYETKNKKLNFALSSFKGHHVEFDIISPFEINHLYIDAQAVNKTLVKIESLDNGLYRMRVTHLATKKESHYSAEFR